MGKFVGAIIGAVEIGVGLLTNQPWLVQIGIATTISGLTSALLAGGQKKKAVGSSVQVGEVARQGVFGEAAIAGSLVDAFNYGGKYGTDWTVLVIALADHECDSLQGFYVYNDYVSFTGDGVVSGYKEQLEVYFRPGIWAQTVPTILTVNSPLYPAGHPLAGTHTWTSADRGRGVCYVVVAYKADKSDAKKPVWSSGQPTFLWHLKGLKTYSAREDTTVGGSGAHRWDDDATRSWSDNLIDCRYTWVRGIYVQGHVGDPNYLLLGRGLSAQEAPPENQFAPANLCDELVTLKAGGSERRYRIGGVFGGDDAYISTEQDFAAACGGIIVDREGSVELVPGAAEAPVWTITDADLVEQTKVTSRDFRTKTDSSWVNMVSSVYVEPSQKWASHSAPLHREDSDVTADGEPRLGQPQLMLVTSGTQAQRVGEQVRRKGRLWRTRSLTLGPRFAGVEHGDWLVWQSKRYGPKPGVPMTPLTFRVVSDNQGEDWRNNLSLEEISADVFDWAAATDELTDTSVSVDSPKLSDAGAPDSDMWIFAAVANSDGSVALRFTGNSSDDTSAASIIFEYAAAASAPDDEDDSAWIIASSRVAGSTTTTTDVNGVLPATKYWGAVSYLTSFGSRSDRLVLGPVTTAAASGTYSFSFWFTEPPAASEVLTILVADQAFTIPANFAGLQSSVGTNPTASFAMDVQRNGVSIGTITVATDGSVSAATIGAAAKAISSGDVIRVIAPATADATAADMAFTIIGAL